MTKPQAHRARGRRPGRGRFFGARRARLILAELQR